MASGRISFCDGRLDRQLSGNELFGPVCGGNLYLQKWMSTSMRVSAFSLPIKCAAGSGLLKRYLSATKFSNVACKQ